MTATYHTLWERTSGARSAPAPLFGLLFVSPLLACANSLSSPSAPDGPPISLSPQRPMPAHCSVDCIFGPLHRIEFSLSRRPDVLVVATLEECLGLHDLFWGDSPSCKARAIGLGGAAVGSLVWGVATQPIENQRGGRGLGLRWPPIDRFKQQSTKSRRQR